jgi:hypothetical protein
MISLICVYLAFHSKYQLFSQSAKRIQPTDEVSNPASDYAIPVRDLERLQAEAKNGNCQAAQRLGAFHMNYTLQYNNAVKWFRIAAKCPEVSPKEYLIILLIHVKNHPEVDAEVDRLISEIQAIEPARAAKLRTDVNDARHAVDPDESSR